MKFVLQHLLAATLALAALAVQAAPAAVIEGVQMPAWVEHAGIGAIRRTPLAPGMELRGGDELHTGAGARVYVKLSEGSLIKLGENASLRILELAPESDGLFKAALHVLEGAFRFTTDVLAKPRRRDVRIQVANVTAGIRGTDLWGKSESEKQIVCLIEGKIEVGAEGESPVTMDEPRQFYQRLKGQTQPVGFVEPTQLAQWAQQTEIADGAGAARRGGHWKATLARAGTQAEALALYDRLRDAGYAAHLLPEKAGDGHDYLVRITGLASKLDAEAIVERLRGIEGVKDPRVTR
ncbi:MAG: FecR domain-containing protein [Burkholderiales bacterium]